MDFDSLSLVMYGIPIVFSLIFLLSRRRKHHKTVKRLEDYIEAGMTEPASLHPVINTNRCVGCAACVPACPEGQIIGIIKGKAQLLNPTKCIGHGACKAACPFDAITLVFGTEKRGVDIPDVSENFETNIPGLFIAGELGGMGLIRNAITQGTQAMGYIAKRGSKGKELDVVVIGAGPSGFAATLGAHERKMKYKTFEQDSLGGTVYNFPRGKLVMTAPVILPIIGTVKMFETTKEKLLELWNSVEKKTGIKINYLEKMENIEPNGEGFTVTTNKGTYETSTVLFCLGRRGSPRKLGVSGEEDPKVVYRLNDPADYINKHVLIVGGGDSALEAATSIAEVEGSKVTISYRSPSFSRAKQKNQDNIKNMSESGELTTLMSSTVSSITATEVKLDQEGESVVIKNDGIIVCAGGILPTPFLKKIGIVVETKHGNV
ncbi:MAG: NAD(P)-binding domain-containing protein [Gammaproteobacteria bacterium]